MSHSNTCHKNLNRTPLHPLSSTALNSWVADEDEDRRWRKKSIYFCQKKGEKIRVCYVVGELLQWRNWLLNSIDAGIIVFLCREISEWGLGVWSVLADSEWAADVGLLRWEEIKVSRWGRLLKSHKCTWRMKGLEVTDDDDRNMDKDWEKTTGLAWSWWGKRNIIILKGKKASPVLLLLSWVGAQSTRHGAGV